MKKLILIFMAVGIIMAGCAKKDAVKPVEQPKQEKAAQTDNNLAEKDKSIPVEKVASSDNSADQALKSSRATQELQAKLKDIHFDFDKYTVRNEDKPAVKEVSSVLLNNKHLKVTIEGHCDERGTNEYNLALGDKRANAVKESLLSLGISSGRMDTISYGEEKPLCTESTEACWANNRRAHFVLSEAGR